MQLKEPTSRRCSLLLLLYMFERQRLVTNARQPILSDANIQASSSVIVPISSWITSAHALRGRPRWRFHDGLGDIPFWMLSDTRSASCAGTPGSRRTTQPLIWLLHTDQWTQHVEMMMID